MPRKVLIAFSPFKGVLSNIEACQIAEKTLTEMGVETLVQPIADGGLGTANAFFFRTQSSARGEWLETPVTGPLGKTTTARLLCFPNTTSPDWILLEGAQAFGHHLVAHDERDAMRATSFGFGTWLKESAERFPKAKIFIGLGDSAISDAGLGMLIALGYRCFDATGKSVAANAHGLRSIQNWEVPTNAAIYRGRVTVLCDVLNPLCGPHGSAKVFSPQKGAAASQVTLIQTGMEHFATQMEEKLRISVRHLPMTGSAGGISAALFAFLGAELVQGSRYLLDWVEFNAKLSECTDLLIGEGKTDLQSLNGKATGECLRRGKTLEKKTHILSGIIDESCRDFLLGASTLACGNTPNAQEALRRAVLTIFSK